MNQRFKRLFGFTNYHRPLSIPARLVRRPRALTHTLLTSISRSIAYIIARNPVISPGDLVLYRSHTSASASAHKSCIAALLESTSRGARGRICQDKPRRRTLALISHDGKKADMVGFVKDHRERLAEFDLVGHQHHGPARRGKGGTCRSNACLSGPYGGDAQIAAMVAEGKISAVFLLCRPAGQAPARSRYPGACCAFATCTMCRWRRISPPQYC